MALIVSASSGNFNSTSTWVGGVVPTVGDEARASNGHTVTITANVTCDELSNDGTGIFTLNAGVTLTANITSKTATAGGTSVVQFTATAPNQASIIGNITAGTADRARGVNVTSTGTLNITGNIFGHPSGGLGSSGGSGAVNNASSGVINITGICNGGGGNPAIAVNNASSGIINIIGNINGASSSANGFTILNGSTGTINITGNVTGGSGSNTVVFNGGSGVIIINGNCTGGATGASTAAGNNGRMTITGTLTASEFASAVGGGNRTQITLLSGPFYTSPVNGVSPITALAWRWNSGLNPNTFIEVPTSNLSGRRNFVTPDNATNFPSGSDVRAGITYGISGALVGTCVIPPSGAVAFGVPVDSGVGSATLDPADMWNYNLINLNISGSIGSRLRNSATISSVGDQIAAF